MARRPGKSTPKCTSKSEAASMHKTSTPVTQTSPTDGRQQVDANATSTCKSATAVKGAKARSAKASKATRTSSRDEPTPSSKKTPRKSGAAKRLDGGRSDSSWDGAGSGSEEYGRRRVDANEDDAVPGLTYESSSSDDRDDDDDDSDDIDVRACLRKENLSEIDRALEWAPLLRTAMGSETGDEEYLPELSDEYSEDRNDEDGTDAPLPRGSHNGDDEPIATTGTDSSVPGPGDRFMMDATTLATRSQEVLTGTHGYKYAVTLIDTFNKGGWIFPTKTLTASELMPVLRQIFKEYLVPDLLHTENGGQFCNKQMEMLAAKLGFTHVTGPARSPESHGQIERFNRTQD